MTGPLSAAFWGVRVGLGILIPIGILAVPRLRAPSATGLAAILALLGILVDRTLFVAAGEIVPRTTMAGTIGYPFAQYTPSPVELGILVGAMAFMAMVYSLCERYLPMGEGDVHVFWPWPWIKKHDDHDADAAPELQVEAARGLPADAGAGTDAGPAAVADDTAVTASGDLRADAAVTVALTAEPSAEPSAEAGVTAEPMAPAAGGADG